MHIIRGLVTIFIGLIVIFIQEFFWGRETFNGAFTIEGSIPIAVLINLLLTAVIIAAIRFLTKEVTVKP